MLEFFFPSLQKVDNTPAETLVAPFADPGVKSAKGSPEGLPENAVPLNVPHRNTAQIADWAVMAASEAMTFDKDDYNESFKSTEKYFTPAARQQYLTFLKDTHIMNVIESKKFFLRGFVQDVPMLLNEGNVEGRYRWLYEVPVMLTYMDRNMQGYKNSDPANQQMTLNIQVGRTSNLETGHDIAVEIWTGKVQDITKK